MSNDDHRRGFGASLATLLAEFGSYLDQDDANPTADMVSYRQVPVWLSAEEKRALYDRLLETIRPYLRQEPTPTADVICWRRSCSPRTATPAAVAAKPQQQARNPETDAWANFAHGCIQVS